MPASMRLISYLVAASVGGGCATMVKGGTEEVEIRSDPPAAHCTMVRQDQTLAMVETPRKISISRSRFPVRVDCSKPGYLDGWDFLLPDRNAISYADILIPASAVNLASGAAFDYPSTLTVWLPPRATGGSSPAAAVLQAGPHDGVYRGTFDATRIPFRSFVEVEMTAEVVSGHGTGTVTSKTCPGAGELRLTIAPSGEVHGGIELKTADCQSRRAPLEGAMKDGRMIIRVARAPAYLVKDP